MDIFLGGVVIILAYIAIYLMSIVGVEMALRERNEERIEREVERRVKYILAHAEIRVKQKLYIVDEMNKESEEGED